MTNEELKAKLLYPANGRKTCTETRRLYVEHLWPLIEAELTARDEQIAYLGSLIELQEATNRLNELPEMDPVIAGWVNGDRQ